MTPETRKQLEQKLNEHGLTVVLTKDWNGILRQLARLAQFERLMETKAGHDTRLADIIKMVRVIQGPVGALADEAGKFRPLEIEDVPIVLTAAHKHLHDQLGNPALLDPSTVQAAVSAFVAILCRR